MEHKKHEPVNITGSCF